MRSNRYSSRYTSSKRYVTSTEISYADHKAKSSYLKESSMESSEPRGTTSSSKELITGSDIRTLPVYIAIREYKPDPKDRDALPLEEGQIVEVLDSKNPASWLVRTKSRPPQTGWVPGSYFETPGEYYKQKRSTREIGGSMTSKEEALSKRDAVFAELLKSEEEFVQDLHHLINTYLKIFDDPSTPSAVRQLREQLSLNLRELYNFHANVLLKGLQYYSDNPGKVGQTFVRLERDFDHHVKYCRDEPDTEKLLEDERIKEHMQRVMQEVERKAEKTLKFVDYLRLPIKRLQQYQSYIKDLIKYTARAELDTESLQKALELVLCIPQRATDLNYIRNIQDYPGDTVKLGRLLRHDDFQIWDETKTEIRSEHAFLFKSKIVMTEKHEAEDHEELPEFKYRSTIKLDKYDVKEDYTDSDTFVLRPTDATLPKFYMKSRDTTNADFIRQAWMKDVKEAKEGLVLHDEEMETMTEFVDMSEIKSEFSDYSTPSRKSSLYGVGDEGPPRKKPKSPPAISPSASSGSIGSSTGELTGTGSGTLEMQGTRVTKTQYGFRTLQESSAKMCLKVSGFPLPIITWFKDDVQLQEDERHKFYSDEDGFFAMTIDPVLVDDTGRYTCVATNEYGQATTSAFFRVVKVEKEPQAPKFVKEPQDLEIAEGQSARFECEVEGWPEPEVQFFIDGHLVQQSKDFRIEYDGQKAALRIQDAQPEDSGMYTIKLSNDAGSAEAHARLTVRADPEKNKIAPEFQQKITDKTVDEGDTVKFKVVCTGDPAPDVFWSVNGSLLTESDKIHMLAEDGIYILTINDVTTHFDGDVVCKAVNRLGEVSCDARLTVRVRGLAPRFDQALTDLSLSEGQRSKVEVTVRALPDAMLHWYLDGKPIKETDSRFRVSSVAPAGIFGLEILNASPDLTGILECHAENDFGEAVSRCKLTVISPVKPPVIMQGLSDVNILEDETLKLQVVTESDVDASNVKWRLNGKEIKSSWNINISKPEPRHFALEISKINVEQGGLFQCFVDNEAGQAQTRCHVEVEQKVLPPPTVTKKLPPETKVKEWENLILEVEVDVDSQPKKYAWFLNGKELKDDKTNVKITTSKDQSKSTLEISRVSTDHAGKILCKVDNRSDSSFTDGEVVVVKRPTRRPSLAQGPVAEISAQLGQPVAVSVSTTNKVYEETVVWKVNGRQVSGDDINFTPTNPSPGQYELKIDKVTRELNDSTISYKVTNEVGSVEGSTVIRVKSEAVAEEIKPAIQKKEPKFTVILRDESRLVDESVEFATKVEGQPTPDVWWKLNGRELKPDGRDVIATSSPDGRHTLEIRNLTPEHSGIVECVASNELGSKSIRCELTVVQSTRRLSIGGKPNFLTGVLPISIPEGETLKSRVVLSGDRPQIRWYVNNKLVVESDDVALTSSLHNGNYVFVLEIDRAKHEMSGALKCVATNARGEATSSAPINVTAGVPVEFEQYLADTECREGDTLKLKAVLLGEPSPDVTWYINNKKLEDSQNIKIYAEKSTYIVVIKNITCDMTGEVLCKAVNEYGEANSSAYLRVLPRGTPPDFTEWLSNVNVKEGSVVTHKVVFTGEPTPNIVWYINSKEIHDSENFRIVTKGNTCTLTINRFTSDLVGEIICKAENDAGEVSCTANMNLFSGRIEVEELSERSELLAMAEGEEASEAGTMSIAEEEITSEEESSIRVATPIQAPKFITKIKDTKVRKGHQAIFECVVPDTKGVCVKWLKDGKEIELIARIRVCQKVGEIDMTQYHQLIIESVTEADKGVYTCVISNEVGESVSTANLEIIESIAEEIPSEFSPEFVKNLASCTVVEGKDAVLECKVTGVPAPKVQWYKDGSRISPSPKLTIESTEDGVQKLIIKDVTVKDTSVYQVVVSNAVGTAKQEAKIMVQAISEEVIEETAPEFSRPLANVQVGEGQVAVMECHVVGQPEPEIRFYKEETVVQTDQKHKVDRIEEGVYKLVLYNASESDIGQYKAVACNVAGKAESKARLDVKLAEYKEELGPQEFAPEFVTHLRKCSVNLGETAVLECKVKGTPSPSILWLKDGERIEADSLHATEALSDGTVRLTIQRASKEDVGEYLAVISSPVGRATSEGYLDVKVPEYQRMPEAEGPVRELEFVTDLTAYKVDESETAVLTCKIAAVEPTPLIQWYKDQRKIETDEKHKIESKEDGSQTLIILETKIEDTGAYTVEAISEALRATSEGYVDVALTAVPSRDKAEGTLPIFTKHLASSTVVKGQNVTLECQIEADEKPEVIWLKEGQALTASKHIKLESIAGGVHKLIILEATESDAGQYKIEAVTTSGTITSQCDLEVTHEIRTPEKALPAFIKLLTGLVVTEGETVTLDCKIKAEGRPEIFWYKDGQRLSASKYVKIESLPEGVQKLTILEVTAPDAGDYKVEVIDDTGTISTECHLDVFGESKAKGATLPVVTKLPTKYEVVEGQTVTFECNVQSEIVPQIFWYKDNKKLTTSKHIKIDYLDDGRQKLTIIDAVPADVGEYKIEVITEAGTTTSECQLLVAERTEVAEQPQPISLTKLPTQYEVIEGQTVTFDCRVKSEGVPQIFWYKDGQTLTSSKNIIIEQPAEDQSTLIISETSVADRGEYKVEVVSESGAVASSECQLEVKEVIVPTFAKLLSNVRTVEGQTIKLECQANVPDQSEIIWYKDKQRVVDSSNINVESLQDGRQTLTVFQVSEEDAGDYRIEIKTPVGIVSCESSLTVESSEIKVQVMPTAFSKRLTSQEVIEGQTISLECGLKSRESPTVFWYKDEERVVASKDIKIEKLPSGEQKLTILEATEKDSGVYKIEVETSSGLITCEARVDVVKAEAMEAIPSFSKSLVSKTVTVGEQVTLECEIDIDNKSTVQWFKDGRKINTSKHFQIKSSPDGRQALSISDIEEHDRGEYKIEVVTPYGVVSSKAQLQVVSTTVSEDIPQFVQPIESVTVVQGQTINLQCQIESKEAPVIRWYKDGQKLTVSKNIKIESLPDGVEKLTILEATKSDVGDYKVEAVTSAGTIVSSSHVEVTEKTVGEKGPRFVKALSSHAANDGQTIVFECRVEADKPIVHWFKDGQKLDVSKRIKIESSPDGTQKLIIDQLSSLDAGYYKIQVATSSGTIFSEGSLDIRTTKVTIAEDTSLAAPEFVDILRECKADVGEEAAFICRVTGVPTPEVKWFKDGQEVSSSVDITIQARPGGVHVLTVRNASDKNVGEYRCEASNKAGTAWTEAPLILRHADEAVSEQASEEAPDFLEPLKAVVAKPGEEVRMQCRLTGKPAPEVVWYKNGEKLKPDDHVELEVAEGGVHALVLRGVDAQDMAEYRCQAENEAGIVWSDATLTIRAPLEPIVIETIETAAHFVTTLRKSSAATEGEELRLECKVEGAPKPEIRWFRDQKPLQPSEHVLIEKLDDGTQRLVLPRVERGDVGEYACEAINKLGSDRTQTSLSVSQAMEVETHEEFAPEFSQELRESRVDEGARALFECKVVAQPAPVVRWFKDGQKVEPDQQRIKVESLPDGSQKLIIEKVMAEDQGNYRCEASNVAGSMSSKAPLSVHVAEEMEVDHAIAPEFSVQLHEVKVKEGVSAHFECALITPGAKVQWYKDDKALSPGPEYIIESLDDGRQHLTVYRTKSEDVGHYHCVAVTPAGRAETAADLLVEEEVKKPEFTRGLKSVSVKAGEQVCMSCQINMTKQKRLPVIKWYKNGTQLMPNQRLNIVTSDSGQCTLFVNQSTEEDAGTYMCEISNEAGAEKTEAPVTVEAVKPPEFISSFPDISATEGDNIELEAKISGKPFPDVKWMKDGKEVRVAGAIKSQKDEDTGVIKLQIENVKPEHEGTYRCIISNMHGTASIKADVMVEARPKYDEKRNLPKFVSGLKDVEVPEGEDILLYCKIDGKPFPDVLWYKGNVPIKKDDDRYVISSDKSGLCMCRIKSSVVGDTAEYTCKLTNAIGSAEDSCKVVIEAKIIPEFLRGLEDRNVTTDTMVVFEVELNVPNPTIRWYKNGVEMRSNSRVKLEQVSETVFKLTIQRSDAWLDTAEYTCEAINSNGKSVTKGRLTVAEEAKEEVIALKFTKGLQDTKVKSGQKLLLEVEVEGKPHSVKWYKAGRELKANDRIRIEKVDDHKYRLSIEESILDDGGQYSVGAENESGSATSSAKIEIETIKFPQIVRELKDTESEEGGRVVFEAEISGRPKVVKWYRSGQELFASDKITVEQQSETVFRLTLDDVGPDAEGIYRIRAENEAGSVASEASLTIRKVVPARLSPEKAAPAEAALTLMILKTLEDKKIKERDSLEMEVELNSAPTLLKWYKGQQELKQDDRTVLESISKTTFRLIRTDTVVDDSGTYRVVASNDSGTVSSEANVTVEAVEEKPRIVKGLENLSVEAGSPAVLTIEVAKKPKTIKWYKNGREMTATKRILIETVDDTHYRLAIPETSEEDQTNYSVRVENDVGSDESSAELTVRKPAAKPKSPSPRRESVVELALKIVRGLTDVKCVEENEVAFEVEFSDRPVDVKWYRKGTQVQSTNRLRLETVKNTVYRLVITKSQLDDAGSYKVEALSSTGEVLSSSAVLGVEPLVRAPEIIKGLKSAEVEEGGRIAFEVQASGKPKVIKWYKNGRELQANQRISIEKVDDSHFRLSISDAQPDDDADFVVSLANDAGSADSEAHLTVKRLIPREESPKEAMEHEVSLTMTKMLQDKSAKEGDNVGFDVEFNAEPDKIKWYKDGRELTASDKIKIQDLGDNCYRLLLTDVAKEASEGVYKVEAERKGSVASSTAKLSVTGQPPRFKKPLKDVKTPVKSKLILEIEVEGKPKQVKWYKNGKEIAPNKLVQIEKIDQAVYRLIFTEIRKTDEGVYKVVVSNDFGSVESEGRVTVEEAKEEEVRLSFLKGLTDLAVEEGANLALEVQVEGRPKIVKWYSNGRLLEPSKRVRIEQLDEKTFKVLILSSTKSDTGNYKVIASNERDQIESTCHVSVESPKPSGEPEGVAAKFILPLSSQTANEDEIASFTCKVKGQPFPEIAWIKDGLEIEQSNRVDMITQDDGVCKMTMRSLKKDDAGTYTCLAQNIHGGDRTKCTLNVEVRAVKGAEEEPFPPEFVKPLRDKTVIEGEDVILEVKIVGKPMPDVCWYKDGEEIEPSDRIQGRIECIADEIVFRLYIKNVRKNDASLYKCVAKNPYGSASTQGKLMVEVLKPADQSAPKFIIPIADMTVPEGNSAIFDVKIRGKPTPELIWCKHGKEIVPSDRIRFEDMGDSRYRMTVENVTPADAGLYECKAVNSLGSDMCQGNLTISPSKDTRKVSDVNFAPVFNVPLHDRRIPENNHMIVDCFVDAKPRAEIRWFKDGYQLEDNDRIHVETYPDGKCRLRINDFSNLDAGTYKCVAANHLGSAETSANLGVEAIKEDEISMKKEYPPKFIRELVDVRVKEDESASLECQVEGIPFPEIRWFKNGIPVKPTDPGYTMETFDDGTCRLTIQKAKESDMGAFRCLAHNVHGSTNSACLVSVESGVRPEKKKEGEAPIFLRGLTDCWVEKGSDVTLKCQVSGEPRPSIKWYKDGTLLRANDRIDLGYLDDGTVILIIKNSTSSDEGFYRCSAENPFGEVSTIGTVRIQALQGIKEVVIEEGEAPRFIIPLEDCSRGEGATVEFECKVAGKPPPQLKWYKDGALLSMDQRVRVDSLGDSTYRLTIARVTRRDEGNYRCVASNDAGTATSKAVLRIEGPQIPAAAPGDTPPHFTVPLRDVRVPEGQPFELECKVIGSPRPQITWFKDGEPVQPSDRLLIEYEPDGMARLKVPQSRPADEGLYRCVAKNPLGTQHVKANVGVKRHLPPVREFGEEYPEYPSGSAPRVVIPLENLRSKHGQSVTFTCQITGSPLPLIRWFKDGERIFPFGRYLMDQAPDGTVTLTIDQVTPRDGGCYRCIGENDYGSDRTAGDLTVEIKELPLRARLDEELAKGRAPGFLKPLVIQRVRENQQVTFTCLPYGNPFPKIKWLKDGVELKSEGRYTVEALEDGSQRLVIKECTSADEGYYRCVASNDYGTSSTKAELIVEIDYEKRLAQKAGMPPEEGKPRFKKGLQSQTVNEGATAEFDCAISGVPRPSVKWFKGQEQLSPSSKYLIWQDEWGFQRLVILNCRLDDQDDVRCEIENKFGSAKSEASLHVLKDVTAKSELDYDKTFVAREPGFMCRDKRPFPPGFMRQVRNRHVFSGFPAIFDCIVYGNPVPEITWLRNNEPIKPDGRIRVQSCGGNSYALIFLRTLPEDQGEYTCLATNSQGTISSSAILDITVPFLDKITYDGGYDAAPWLADDFDFRKVPYTSIPVPPDRGPFIAEVTGHYLTLSWIPTLRPPPRYQQITYIVEMRELPDKAWTVVDYNIAQPCCKVRNLELGKSYQFRIRAENLYGISEPSPASPPSQLMAPPKPVLDRRRRPIPNFDPYTLEALSRCYADQYACAPWFAPRQLDRVYCGEKRTLEIVFWVYGYPDPEVKWYFRGWEITAETHKDRFETKCYGGTECVLSIRDFGQDDVGQYQCKAVNRHGEAQQNVMVEMATLPTFIQQLENKIAPSSKTIRLDCRVDASPYPEIKWFKDWHPLVESSRIKFVNEPPYLCSLLISNPFLRDTGIYTCSAYNEAGKATSTASLTVEIDPYDYGFDVDYVRPSKRAALQARKIREIYTIEEEIQKNPDYVVRRVKEKATGRKFLAKFYPSKCGNLVKRMLNNWCCLLHPNVVRIERVGVDGDNLCVIYENITGGQLLDRMTAFDKVPETHIAFFIRQLLQALEQLHRQSIIHLDIRPENILLSEQGSDQIKLAEFEFSRKLRPGKNVYGVVGSPEFVAPEIVLQKPVSLSTDMWSVGVLAYVMLTGISPFHGDSDNETLSNVVNVKYTLSDDRFGRISTDAKDFISNLLTFDQKNRMSASQSLAHPWMQINHDKTEKAELLTTHFLKEFNYRHKWVERKIFVQYGPDDELDLLGPYADLEPYAVNGLGNYASATIPLSSANHVNGVAESHEDQPAASKILIKGERRLIEEELANRVLSDISEEGSVVSEEVGHTCRPGGLGVFDRLDMEIDPLTPIPEDATSSGRKPLKIDIDDSSLTLALPPQGSGESGVIRGDRGLKSPVVFSPRSERVMQCTVKDVSPLVSPDSATFKEFIQNGDPGDKSVVESSAITVKEADDLKKSLNEASKKATRPIAENSSYRNQPKRESRLPPAPVSPYLREPIIKEVEHYDWECEYQSGPETFLMQHRDPDFAARIRDYRRRLFGDSAMYFECGILGYLNQDVSVRERRRYTDLVKGDKDLRKMIDVLDKDVKNMHTGAMKRTHNLQILPAPLPASDGSCVPIFHTRLNDTVFSLNCDVTLQCLLVGQPDPQVCWFHDETIVVDDLRHKIISDNGRYSLLIRNAHFSDCGLYKCVASNDLGQTSCAARLKVGELPARCTRPDVQLASDTEVFITWEQPPILGGLSICAYRLEYRRAGERDMGRWITISDTVDEEAVVVRRLEPLGIYQFMVTAKNVHGWGESSVGSRIIQTHNRNAPKLNIDMLRKEYHFNVLSLPSPLALGGIQENEEMEEEASSCPTDNNQFGQHRQKKSKISTDLNKTDDPRSRYQLESEIFRGRFCLIRNAVDTKFESNAHCVVKICLASPEHRGQALNEYEVLRDIQHSGVIQLFSAYLRNDFLLMFVEKMQEDLLTRFTYTDYYTEDHIARVAGQILSALQWIHYKRICFLDLMPDNILLANKRVWTVKLCDTGSAIRMSPESTDAPIGPNHLQLAHSAPEVILLGTCSSATDIWGLGLIVFILLSGMHPFQFDEDLNEEDVRKNITSEKCDINLIHANASQESLKFVAWCLKKQPQNRMNTEEGLQHRWLSLLDSSIRQREKIKFSSNRLRNFSSLFYAKRKFKSTENNQLLSEYGAKT